MTHLYKKPVAVQQADIAYRQLGRAMRLLDAAEGHLKLSGYKGAAHGIHQANERVKDWMGKVDCEIRDAKAADGEKAPVRRAAKGGVQ